MICCCRWLADGLHITSRDGCCLVTSRLPSRRRHVMVGRRAVKVVLLVVLPSLCVRVVVAACAFDPTLS